MPSPKKMYEDKYNSYKYNTRDKNLPTVLANSSNHNFSKQHVH